MMVTCWVVPELALVSLRDGWMVSAVVAAALVPIGILFGFLDSHRHKLWCLLASLIVVWGLHGAATRPLEVMDGKPGVSEPAADTRPRLEVLHYLPAVMGLFAGGLTGAYLINRRVRASTQPQTQVEPDPE